MTSAQRLRIAVLSRHFGTRFGGAERYTVALVEALAGQHEFHVFAQDIEHHCDGVTYHRISRPLAKPRWLNQWWFALQTWRRTRQGFDVVHSHENTWHGQLQAIHVRPFRTGLFERRVGIRRFLKWLALLTSPRLLTYWWLEAARFGAQHDRYFVASSAQVMAQTVQAYPATATRMQVIEPGVTVPTTRLPKHQARQTLGLPEAVPLALFVGNDYIKKGLPTLLQALAKVPELHLAVVGKGQQHERFAHQVRTLHMADRVHFLGALAEVDMAYSAADVLVHPTTEDTYAMVVLEAMAHGLPVIVSRAPYCGMATDLVHGTHALLLSDPYSATELAEHLAHWRDTPALRSSLQGQGLHFAQQRSWHAVANAHHALFVTIAQTRPL